MGEAGWSVKAYLRGGHLGLNDKKSKGQRAGVLVNLNTQSVFDSAEQFFMSGDNCPARLC